MIKSFFKKNSTICICPKEIPVCQCTIEPRIEIITKKALTASKIELSKNSRARSAKMRIARGL